jgi:membrane-bound metal-dependent hydrolase YbcI (DUF457 family)
MILGHLTVTYSVAVPFKKRFPDLAVTGGILLGAVLPDILDKPVSMIWGTPSRGAGHSAVVMGLVSYILIAAFPARCKFLVSVGAGLLLHLLEDMVTLNQLFWPLLGPWTYQPGAGLMEKLLDYYVRVKSPVSFLVEIASYPFFLLFAFREIKKARDEKYKAPTSGV